MQVKLSSGAVLSSVELLGHYGFASSPPPGSEAVFISNGTQRSFLCGWTKGKTPNLKDGETVLFSGEKSQVLLTPQGQILVLADGKNPFLMLTELLETLALAPVSTSQGPGKIQVPSEFQAKMQDLKKRIAKP